LQLAKSLLDLLKKQLSFKWKEEQQKALKDLKEKFLFAVVLKFTTFIKPFEVHTNANDFDVGGVFM
jgi:hypothetical protein